MRHVLRSALLLAFSGLSLSPALFGYVQDTKHNSKFQNEKIFVGHKVIRPSLETSQAALKKFANLGNAQVDSRSGAIRVISGTFADANISKAADAGIEDFVNAALSFIDRHPGLFGSLQSSDLALDAQSVLKDKTDQFFKFRVFRDSLEVQDASVDFRFKFGKLVQVVNNSFSEAKSDRRVSAKHLQLAVESALDVANARQINKALRVVETRQGYRLVRVDVFAVNKDGEPYHAQVESASGKVFELNPQNHYIRGHVHGQIYPRYYKDELGEFDFGKLTIAIVGGTVVVDDQGIFNAASGSNPQLKGYVGKFVDVKASTGTVSTRDATETGGAFDLSVPKNATVPAAEDKDVAQAMIYYHTDLIIERAKKYIQNPWMEKALVANANLSSTCNAHWDGTTINFYSADSQCANTGLISDVMYHEWGHGLDHNFGGIVDGGFSEGFGDIMSMVMTGSHILGIGFLMDGGFVRDLEPDKIYPADAGGGVHSEGLIIGSTFWDLRKGLVAKHGEDAANELMAKYAFKVITTASKYTEVYDALLVIDDNDANLANGTPNLCVINEAFVLHGLATASSACQLGNLNEIKVDEVGGNGNGYIEPGETVDLSATLLNNTGTAITNLTGTGKITTQVAGITLSDDTLTWDDIAADDVQTSSNALRLSLANAVVCGQQFQIAFNLKAMERDVTITKDFMVGKMVGTQDTLAATDLPKPIVDVNTITSAVNVSGSQWSRDAKIFAANLKFDITHTYVGDLKVALVSPAGVEIEVYSGSGSADNVNFDQDVSALLNTHAGKGTWTLKVTDGAADDIGTLDSFQLSLTPQLFECE